MVIAGPGEQIKARLPSPSLSKAVVALAIDASGHVLEHVIGNAVSVD